MDYEPPPSPTGAETFAERFAVLHGMVDAEVRGLTAEQLDFTSDRWRWAGWSIRRQLGHMTSVFSSWLLGIWDDWLFPAPPDWYLQVAAMEPRERWAHFAEGDAEAILAKVRRGIALAEEAVSRETPKSMRDERRVSIGVGRGWTLMATAHPSGVVEDEHQPGLYHLDLEGTLRHCYFEQTTHLFNVQRLKRAQGLPTPAHIPFEGFFALDGWDRGEP